MTLATFDHAHLLTIATATGTHIPVTELKARKLAETTPVTTKVSLFVGTGQTTDDGQKNPGLAEGKQASILETSGRIHQLWAAWDQSQAAGVKKDFMVPAAVLFYHKTAKKQVSVAGKLAWTLNEVGVKKTEAVELAVGAALTETEPVVARRALSQVAATCLAVEATATQTLEARSWWTDKTVRHLLDVNRLLQTQKQDDRVNDTASSDALLADANDKAGVYKKTCRKRSLMAVEINRCLGIHARASQRLREIGAGSQEGKTLQKEVTWAQTRIQMLEKEAAQVEHEVSQCKTTMDKAFTLFNETAQSAHTQDLIERKSQLEQALYDRVTTVEQTLAGCQTIYELAGQMG